jgi:UDP-N-acetylglucosamine:LPS N-acetylglucosamine transferase
MGAGHRRVGSELVRRLAQFGVEAREVDIGELLPRGWGKGLTGLYKFMACRAQWLYEATFRVQMRSPPGSAPVLYPLDRLAERRLGALVTRERPALLLSTFHLSSQVAGRMRAAGRLAVPVASLVLDFYVHGMWVHRGVDAHLLLHRSQLPQLSERGGRRAHVCGPVVRPTFELTSPSWSREAARESLGLAPDELCVLVVGGSWGVGELVATYRVVAADGRFFPVVVAGHNGILLQALREEQRRFSGRAAGVVLGWVDDMDRLMAAADVAVENAGGLTSMEAMARGVPVVTYAPIAGHGRANARAMAAAGLSLYPDSPEELVSCLHQAARDTPERRQLVGEGRSMFGSDPAELIAAWARAGSVEALDMPAPKPAVLRPSKAASGAS